MTFWIFEDGEPIGPLQKSEVVDRARPETLVSHGQKWFRFDEHPHFPGNDTEGSLQAERIETPTKNQATKIGGWSKDLNHPRFGWLSARIEWKDIRRQKLLVGIIAFWILLPIVLGLVFLPPLILDLIELGVRLIEPQQAENSNSSTGKPYKTNAVHSSPPSNEFGPGPCGEHWEDAILAAQSMVDKFDILDRTTVPGQRFDMKLFPGQELELIAKLLLSREAENLPPEQVEVCGELAYRVGIILPEGIRSQYLMAGIDELGNTKCAYAAGAHFLNQQVWHLAYYYLYVAQAANHEGASELLAEAADHLAQSEINELRQEAKNQFGY